MGVTDANIYNGKKVGYAKIGGAKVTVYTLCGKKGCCPVVDVGGEHVTIGEEGNIVSLNKSEWDALVSKIKSGEIQ